MQIKFNNIFKRDNKIKKKPQFEIETIKNSTNIKKRILRIGKIRKLIEENKRNISIFL